MAYHITALAQPQRVNERLLALFGAGRQGATAQAVTAGVPTPV